MKKYLNNLLSLLFGALLWTSCNKDEVKPSPADTIVGLYELKSYEIYDSLLKSIGGGGGYGFVTTYVLVKKNNDTLVDMSIASQTDNSKFLVFRNIVVKDKPKDNLSKEIIYFLYDNSTSKSKKYEWIGKVENYPKLKFTCFAKDTVSRNFFRIEASFSSK